jgi:hypothetical protein
VKREPGHAWSCKQIPNGMNPIVVCERSDLLEQVASLAAKNTKLRIEANQAQTAWRILIDERDTLRGLADDLAAAIAQDSCEPSHAMRHALDQYRGYQP